MNRIKLLREQHGIEQKQLAHDLGVSQPTISCWENGSKQPSSKSVYKLADYFDVSTDYLLGREDAKKAPPPDGDGAGLALQGRPELAALMERLSQLDDDQLRSAEDYLDFILSRELSDDSRPSR